MTPADHSLTHAEVHDSFGRRLVPACTCGWWSPDGSHQAFERHVKRMIESRVS